MKPLFFSKTVHCCDVEQCTRECLDSFLTQSFTNWECLQGVETSKDNTEIIAREYAERDKRFRVFSGPKCGAVATTRNYGIDHAAGKYLVVIDGDNGFVPDMLEKLAGKLEQTGEIDLLTFAASSTETDNVDRNHVTFRKITDADRKQALDKLLSGESRTQFLKLLSRASRPKRLARPLLFLAAKGFQRPAKVFFRKIYYPMLERRSGK